MLRFSLLFLLALACLRAEFSCPSGYTNYNGYCYELAGLPYDYSGAEYYCEYWGGKLATINSPGLNAAISRAANSRKYDTVYLGYQCNSTTQCTGTDGSVINTKDYFYGGQANPKVGACVVMDTSGPMAGKWVSVSCNQSSPFVCGVDVTNDVAINMKTSKCGVPYQLKAPVNISSMNFPSSYDNNENCAYFLYGGPFTITFDFFSTERNNDVVSLYSSSNNYGNMNFLGYYSGQLSPFTVNIGSSAALITFVTNQNSTYMGFSARIVKT